MRMFGSEWITASLPNNQNNSATATLIHRGHHQSHELGENMRKELLFINRALLDDVVTYSSSEFRAIDTAVVFLKAFLECESISDDQVHISKEMLNDSNAAKEQMEAVKTRLLAVLNAQSAVELPPGYPPLPEGISSPLAFIKDVSELLRERRAIMHRRFQRGGVDEIQKEWCCSESPQLFRERWDRIFREFCDVGDKAMACDIS